MPRQCRGIGSVFVAVCLDGIGNLLVIVEEVDSQRTGYEDAGNQSGGLNTFTGGSAGAVGALAQQCCAGNDHDTLAQLVGEVSGGKEHTGTVLAGLDGIILGKIGKHGSGNDVGNRNGHSDEKADDQCKTLTGDSAYHKLVIVDAEVEQHVSNAGTDEQGLLAHISGRAKRFVI